MKKAGRQGRLYLVGVGPGDPELMTYKAVRILVEDTGAVPKARENSVSSALRTLRPWWDCRSRGPVSWEESQYSDGTAVFAKAGENKITGKWKVENSTLCWCYGTCRTYQCKYVIKSNDDSFWYYIDPDQEKKIGKVTEWREISG